MGGVSRLWKIRWFHSRGHAPGTGQEDEPAPTAQQKELPPTPLQPNELVVFVHNANGHGIPADEATIRFVRDYYGQSDLQRVGYGQATVRHPMYADREDHLKSQRTQTLQTSGRSEQTFYDQRWPGEIPPKLLRPDRLRYQDYKAGTGPSRWKPRLVYYEVDFQYERFGTVRHVLRCMTTEKPLMNIIEPRGRLNEDEWRKQREGLSRRWRIHGESGENIVRSLSRGTSRRRSRVMRMEKKPDEDRENVQKLQAQAAYAQPENGVNEVLSNYIEECGVRRKEKWWVTRDVSKPS